MLAAVVLASGFGGFVLGILLSEKLWVNPLKNGLEVIKEYGKRNSGYGYQCHRIASNVLENKEPKEGVKYK